jgi:hypothetical protein
MKKDSCRIFGSRAEGSLKSENRGRPTRLPISRKLSIFTKAVWE